MIEVLARDRILATREGPSDRALDAMLDADFRFINQVASRQSGQGWFSSRVLDQAAEDLTQEFFLRFYQRGWIERADPQRGRFRTFLLTILTRFLADQGTERAPRQQVFDERLATVSVLLGDADRTFEPPDNRTPEQVFMQHWARSIIANVQQSLESWCANRSVKPLRLKLAKLYRR